MTVMPVDQLAKIALPGRGRRAEAEQLGGKSWETMRRAPVAAELAGELLNLYAERKKRTSHAFRTPTGCAVRGQIPETPDGGRRSEASKRDTEAAADGPPHLRRRRLRQTEVALRAAFKAVDDGSGYVLAPTTILAQQHYGNFAERLKDYPFRVDPSRASAPPRSSAG